MVAFELRVLPAARRHGVSDAEIVHAYNNAIACQPLDNEARPGNFMLVGPDWAANLIEIICVQKADGTVLVFHAMRLRAKNRDHLLDWEER